MKTRELTLEILAEQTGYDIGHFMPEMTLAEAGVDSLDLVELSMAYEDEHGIDIPERDMDGLKTVGDLVSYIERRVNPAFMKTSLI
jgi:acyl carrier protein